RSALIPACLLLLGLAMRTFGAWVYEFAHTSDHGIICLMVKHMLEGKEFPVFFYGLPYMGSLEPSVSAGLCWLFGLNGFWINMGTALTAFAFLPLVFLWGRGAAGWAAGVAALAFCVIGPPNYFQFESWADGGYAAIPLLSCAVLLASVRMLIREGEGRRCSHWEYLGLGLIAGLGWWQSPLLIPAFLVCGFLFLLLMRKALFSLRLFTGAAGFFLGSAPLWIWNVRNHWQTFDMVRTHDSPSLFEGLKLFYLTRLPDLLEFHRQPAFFRYALGALLLLLAALALARLVSAIRARNRPEVLYLSAAFLFLVVFSILFGRSRFARVNALRYVLILIPVLGVLLGAATAWLTARVRWGLGWLPLVALVTLQGVYLPNRLKERKETEAVMAPYAALGEFLREKGVRGVYADYQVRRGNHALNFVLNEEFVFSPLTRERYRPYARALELADHPAVLNAAGNLDSFLAAGGQAETGGVNGLRVHYNIRAPAPAWKPVDGDLYRVEADFEKRYNMWVLGVKGPERADMTVRLYVSKRLAGFRLFFEEGAAPAALAADRWDEGAKRWAPVLPSTPVTRYFWSGPRFYWGGAALRAECFFPPVETAMLRIRVKRPARGDCRIVLVQPLEEDRSATVPTGGELNALAETIRKKGYTRVYSDRWEAGQLHKRLPQNVALVLQPHLFERPVLPPEMTLDEHTAIVLRRSESDWSLDTLLDRVIRMRRKACGPWDIMAFDKGQSLLPYEQAPGLRWRGAGCLRERDREWSKAANESARLLMAETNFVFAAALAEHAFAAAPDYQPLALTLADCYNGLGDFEKGSNYAQLARGLWAPAVPVPAQFGDGVELLGIRTERGPGNRVEIRYYWRLAKEADINGLTAFVHIKNRDKEMVVQDDHAFLEGMDVPRPFEPDAVWVEKRMVTLSANIPVEELNLEMGLYRPRDSNRRFPVKSAFDNGHRAVLIPRFLDAPVVASPPK
ncbi:MAG: hypothetical protein R6X19_04260, partial [Kiritimatiellia bacterium]